MRYFKVTLIIGFLVSLLVGGLFEAGVFRQLDLGLGNFLGVRFSPVSSRWTQYPLFILLAFGIAWTTVDIPRTSLKAIISVGAFVELITVVWVLNLFGLFFSPFPSGLAIIASFLLGFIYSRTEAGSRKKVVRAIFGDRISKKTFATLVNTDVPLPFEGELREATVVICEIFNHDELTEALPVPDYVAMNNAFLRNAADYLVERGGYLDECDGESLRVVFGAPVPDRQHAATASEAALALTARLDDVNRECIRVWKRTFDFRIGLNSGEMVVAAYGSRRLGTFSVAGEPVEWARRLCAANMIYGSRLLLGSQTYQLAEDALEVRPLELVQRHPEDRDREEIYELLARRRSLSEEDAHRRDLFWKGVVYFREQLWDEALAHFSMALRSDRPDGPVDFYIRRVEQLRIGGPTLEWNPTDI
ncbi:adenylate/guanylate cyclase domain-containing protein [Verrucomicrobiota bacterium sgz303538]